VSSSQEPSGFTSREAREALAEAAEDARLDDALSLEDVNPVEPRVIPGNYVGRSVVDERAREARLRRFGRAHRSGQADPQD
jgi:hypothetical protein